MQSPQARHRFLLTLNNDCQNTDWLDILAQVYASPAVIVITLAARFNCRAINPRLALLAVAY
jgi:hypothetical protein